MKVLVTGAAGFIGSHVSEMLAARGDTVIGVDNFNDYYDPNKKLRNAKNLEDNHDVMVIKADIRDRERMMALFEEHRFDAVAHIAAMAGVRNSVANPALYIDVDLVGTQHLMDAAREFNVSNFVFASTSSIYGDTQQIPFVETDTAAEPPQPYAAAKRAAELLGFTYHKLFKLNFTAVRFFTVYGPRGRPDMMPYLLAESIYHSKQIPLYQGDFKRDWTFVEDTAKGVVLALDKPLGYEIINLGKGHPEPLLEFIDEMETIARKKANFISKPKLEADMFVTYANIEKAQRLLDFNPQVSMKEGVKRFWEWYVEQQEALAPA